MKSYVLCLIVASFARLSGAAEFGDISLFLPFLRAYVRPPSCPPNEVYKTCTGKCSDCTQRGMCIVRTCNQGCDCAPYYYRVTPDGPCEPVAKCPKPECGANEVFRECGPVCERCTTLRCRAINCDHKCYCREGHLRNSEGACVPERECPIRRHCSPTEEWAESGPANEFCLTEGKEGANDTLHVAQCYCKPEHKRNVLGYCVKESFCPFIRCPGVETFHDCIPKCNTTCRNYGDPHCTEGGDCYPGCFCPPGHVMNDFRACIPVDACSTDTPQVKIVESSMIVKEEEETSEPGTTTESSIPEATSATAFEEEGGASEESPKEETEIPPGKNDLVTTESPTPEGKPQKRKIVKTRSSKYANAAPSRRQASKFEALDEEDFENEEI